MGDLILNFNKGIRRKTNPEHHKIIRKLSGIELAKANRELRKKQIPRLLPNDENFKRLSYIRYGDQFIIGIIGSNKDSLKIQIDLKEFLKTNLNLEWNIDNTIKHASTDRVNFLGFEIHITPINKRVIQIRAKREDPHTMVKVQQTSRPLISVPVSVLVSKLNEIKYCRGKRNNPTRVGRLIHLTPSQIVNHFKIIWLIIANYYSVCSNFAALNQVYYILFYSCVLTLASKFRLKTKSKVLKKYGKYITIKTNTGNLITSFPKWGKPILKKKI